MEDTCRCGAGECAGRQEGCAARARRERAPAVLPTVSGSGARPPGSAARSRVAVAVVLCLVVLLGAGVWHALDEPGL
ncbi:hypothetical protein Kpho01_31410 [Kitasatospora phosalacinea]|uniref:Uncharacterized protein n=1 Tax=Kitasatospora phosalacinea TaxID=2065 RepID=A0A9W6PFL6_9ACTN|nr:hypothetical protein Kpho01_31410 [Kitasatospora phosalacinea]